jgi:DNA-binding IclR family transcriptional regulator
MANSIQVLDRALDILEVLAIEKKGLGVTEIGNRVNLHKSTVHRILSTLVERGYIEKDSKLGLYKLGLKVVEISSIHLNSVELKTEAAPFLRKLASETTQPVHLAAMVDNIVVYIDKVETINTIRMYSSIGKRVPIHCSAVGKVILSHMEDDEIREILRKSELYKYTPNTKTDIEEIIKEVKETKKKGWAVDNVEHEENVRCIAAPIYDYRGKVIAAVSTSGVKTVISSDRDNEIKEYVMSAAKEISKRMGYNG